MTFDKFSLREVKQTLITLVLQNQNPRFERNQDWIFFVPSTSQVNSLTHPLEMPAYVDGD